MAEPTSLPPNWEVHASFSIFLYNQIYGNYLYSLGITRCFRVLSTEWGIPKIIPKWIMSLPSNGYLINGKCVFGAEVKFIVQRQAIIECLSLNNLNNLFKRDFKISEFSKLKRMWYSEEFQAGGQNWKIRVDQKRSGEGTGDHVKIYLHYVGSHRVKACFAIRMKSQVSNEHVKHTWTSWFSGSNKTWGWSRFIDIDSFNDPEKGFLVEDCCVLDVEISVKAVTEAVPSSLSV